MRRPAHDPDLTIKDRVSVWRLNPYGSLNVGAEFLYGWAMEQNHESANAPRIQFSVKYSFVKIKADQ